MKLNHIIEQWRLILPGIVGAWMLLACSTMAPVQEMSNARQTLRAAQEVKADRYAPDLLGKAVDLLEAAERHLAQGDYEQARAFALAARQQASRARLKALEQQ